MPVIRNSNSTMTLSDYSDHFKSMKLRTFRMSDTSDYFLSIEKTDEGYRLYVTKDNTVIYTCESQIEKMHSLAEEDLYTRVTWFAGSIDHYGSAVITPQGPLHYVSWRKYHAKDEVNTEYLSVISELVSEYSRQTLN